MRILVLGTGGTIASCSGTNGRAATVDVARLCEAAGHPVDRQRLACRDIALRPSAALSFDDLAQLAHTMREAFTEGADAVVITHGTDALEETAFVLDLVHDGGQPVVLTGAQRPFDDPSPDGPRNLAHALDWAADSRAAGTGVTVTFDGSIWPAAGLRKTETLASGAFAAPGRGALGRAGEAGIQLFAMPVRPPALLDPHEVRELPRVDVVPLYLGCGPDALDAVVAGGARGIVLAAFGAGNATPAIVDRVGALIAQGITVAVASRTGSGPVAALYTGGGGADLERAGAVFGGDLSAWQLRLLVAACLRRAEEQGKAVSVLREWLAGANMG